MKSFSHKFAALVIILLAAVFLCSCGGSGRTGVGPYDFTDYSALEAREEMREAQMEMTMYPIDDYYDSLYEQQATEDAADALADYLYEQYLLEQESGN